MAPGTEDRVIQLLKDVQREQGRRFDNLEGRLSKVEDTLADVVSAQRTRDKTCDLVHNEVERRMLKLEDKTNDIGTNPNIDGQSLLEQVQKIHAQQTGAKSTMEVEKWKLIAAIILAIVGAGGGGAFIRQVVSPEQPRVIHVPVPRSSR
jgi:hypothetical protein